MCGTTIPIGPYDDALVTLRGPLEAVFVRLIIGEKKVVDVEVRTPYIWLMRWTSQPSDAKTTNDIVLSTTAG